eukprot:CAMPEP_0119420184 /NCGR_PEP_ID=MMETSP1335-20130426/22894_1 /TAXON_ID=259385 /ORGANISM="Chrysoculter rhomboideus, Strain RCC1486" /LENGTH=175 /DNA_ID=CAMNT_0007445527 /DNA_START=67 /DNA_END=594 /DNA_ORIENTATION=+
MDMVLSSSVMDQDMVHPYVLIARLSFCRRSAARPPPLRETLAVSRSGGRAGQFLGCGSLLYAHVLLALDALHEPQPREASPSVDEDVTLVALGPDDQEGRQLVDKGEEEGPEGDEHEEGAEDEAKGGRAQEERRACDEECHLAADDGHGDGAERVARALVPRALRLVVVVREVQA